MVVPSGNCGLYLLLKHCLTDAAAGDMVSSAKRHQLGMYLRSGGDVNVWITLQSILNVYNGLGGLGLQHVNRMTISIQYFYVIDVPPDLSST